MLIDFSRRECDPISSFRASLSFSLLVFSFRFSNGERGEREGKREWGFLPPKMRGIQTASDGELDWRRLLGSSSERNNHSSTGIESLPFSSFFGRRRPVASHSCATNRSWAGKISVVGPRRLSTLLFCRQFEVDAFTAETTNTWFLRAASRPSVAKGIPDCL